MSIADPEVPPIVQALEAQPKKQFYAGIGKRLSGRPPNSSRDSLRSQTSYEDLPAAALATRQHAGHATAHKHHHVQHSHHDKLLTEVAEWLHAEKAKRAARRANKQQNVSHQQNEGLHGFSSRRRAGSESSDSSLLSLDKLQQILDDNMTDFGNDRFPSASPGLGLQKRPPYSGHGRMSSTRSLSRHASSDTDYQDGDVVVPSCDVVLDNSKTLGYVGGAAASDPNLIAMGDRAEKDQKAWSKFKSELLRLAHTLRLKGWRTIPPEACDDIDVKRLSGALTNAVYVVSPPKDNPVHAASSTGNSSKKPPPRLLLRIYGPQVEHLIDRENELGILRRLARKKIGPRLLGTFRNGRFEEFFDSTTLTSADLHVPETSKQIAKRMRELHEGIDLLELERDEGPFVWRNWDKWVDRCEHVVTFLDRQIIPGTRDSILSRTGSWKARGFVCGVEWPLFRGMIEKYRKFLTEHYGGPGAIKEKLVFAHNDVSVSRYHEACSCHSS